MGRCRRLTVAISILVLLTAAACGAGWLMLAAQDVPYANPPESLQDSDLVGTWETRYGRSVDRLILRADGTFKQVYQDNTVEGYVYETPWNEWWLERFPDGRVWVHLQGARYYLAGIRIAELEGLPEPAPTDQPELWGKDRFPLSFYDPFGKEFLEMVGELILSVRSDDSGEIILHHMWGSADRGFAIIGGEMEVFRRIETP